MTRLFDVIYEDDGLLVLNKPAGLVCHPTKTDEYSSLISRARLYLGQGSQPQLVNRLDRETSGITVVAKRADAALELRRMWEGRQVSKEYLAIVQGHVQNESGVIEAPLGKDEASRVVIKDCVREDGAPARTQYRVEKRFARTVAGDSEALRLFSLLRVQPETGKKHQIRIHLAHLGHSIVGDKLYGEDEDLYLALVEDRLTEAQWQRLILPHQALHAAELRFEWRGEPRVFRAAAETWFTAFQL
jgi:23S rRNA pseudouridine1911/1915/1917 synthase